MICDLSIPTLKLHAVFKKSAHQRGGLKMIQHSKKEKSMEKNIGNDKEIIKEQSDQEKMEKLVKSMNKQLAGLHSIAMLTRINIPKYLGKFISVETVGNSLLFRFSEINVFLQTGFMIFSTVGEANKDGSFPGKDVCDELYIGDKPFGDIFNEIVNSWNSQQRR